MNINVKEHIQVVTFPLGLMGFDYKGLQEMSDSAKLNLAQISIKRGANIYANLRSFQAALNRGLIDTQDNWTFFIDV